MCALNEKYHELCKQKAQELKEEGFVEITDTLGPGVFDWVLCGKAQNGLVPIKA